MDEQRISADDIKIGVLTYIKKQVVKRKITYNDMISIKTKTTIYIIGGDIRGVICTLENGICKDILNQGIEYKLVEYDKNKNIDNPIMGITNLFNLEKLLVMSGFHEGTIEELRRVLDRTIYDIKWIEAHSKYYFGSTIKKYGPLTIKRTDSLRDKLKLNLNLTMLPPELLSVIMIANTKTKKVSGREKRLALKYSKLNDISY